LVLAGAAGTSGGLGAVCCVGILVGDDTVGGGFAGLLVLPGCTGAGCGFASCTIGLASPNGLGGCTCRVVSGGFSGFAPESVDLACVTGAASLGDCFVSAVLGVAGG
jgi:hypothetical protein